MKKILLLISFYSALCSMDNDDRLQQFREHAKNHPEIIKELKAPVFVDHKGNDYYFSFNTQNDVRTEQLDVSLYRYKNMLECKMRLAEETENEKRFKEKQRIDSLYKKVSILCIILGHISGIW